MRVREPVVAGQFYPADKAACQADLLALLEEDKGREPSQQDAIGGIVPHAGWMYSGSVAAKVFRCLAKSPSPQVIVIFGGVHRARGQQAAMFADGRWDSPLGEVHVDGRLAERIMSQTNLIADDPFAHELEHSIEVQIPFIAHLFPGVKIVPIMVPPSPKAAEVGQAVARTIDAYKYQALFIGTTDLTHYGPAYRFTPHGEGQDGLDWAKTKNDRRFIDLVCSMDYNAVVNEAAENRSACSAGAVAATIAAAEAAGARRGVLLEHTTSGEVAGKLTGASPKDSVGYAGIVFT